MIGPSPSYIPSDYNDIHAGIFTNPLAEHDPNFYPSPEHVAAASYGAPYDGYVNGNTAAQPAINDYSRSSQSVSPRTGYEGWKEANEPYITPDPNNPNLVQPSGATTFAANGDHQFNFQSPLGPHNTTNQDTPYNPSSQHTFSSPNDSRSYTDAQMNNFQITNYAHDLTSTPESSHYSSPPTASATFQGYENTTMHPLPVLFASDQVPGPAQSQPYYNPVANTSPTRFTIHEGRKIAGTARAQRSNTSLSTGGIKTGTTMGSGVSPATSFSIAQSNPYSPSYGQQPQQRSHSMQQPSSPTKLRTSSTPFPTSGGAPGQTVGQVSTSNSKKRTRHEPSESLSVPAQRYGNLLQTVATGATTSVNHTNQFPVRFESGATTATFEDDSDTEESDAADGPTGGGSQRGPHRGGKANATRARGKKGAAGQGRAGEVARLPGACRNCKRLKMKCVFESDTDMICKRCRDGGKECVVEGRKQRQPSNKREQLMNLLREKDKLVDALLRQVYSPSKLMPVSFRAPSPSAASQGHSSGGKLSIPPPPPSATTSAKDIYAWLATSNSQGRSPRNTDAGAGLDDSSDEEEAAGRAGLVDIDAREKSLTLSDMSQMDSVSQRGGSRTRGHAKDDSQDRLDVGSSTSSNRRPSTGDLPKMHAMPSENAPFWLLATMSLDSQTAEERGAEREKQRQKLASISGSSLGDGDGASQAKSTGTPDPGPVRDPLEDEALGPANKNYWRPGPLANMAFRRVINERNPPELLASGIINLEDVDKLFKIFYDRLNVFLSILDPVIHSPADVYSRCPFLFTAICAVSSRYYTEKPWVYNVAMHFARVAAAMALVEGSKSVEICQAYIIMSVYPLPARRWEEDRSWLYLRLAIGMATDLALHIPSSTTKFIDERHEREILNRARTWIICFNLDRSGATQFGKPPSIKEDSIIRSAETWYKKSVNNHCYDIHMVAYTSLLRIVAGFMEEVYSNPDAPTGLNRSLDFEKVTPRYDARLQAFRDETAARFAKESDPSDPACKYRSELLPFLVNYSRLVMFSFGFQQAFQQGRLDRGNMFLTACLDSASSVLRIVIEVLAPSGYLRYAADGHFVFAAFASAFLLKLLRPQFSYLLEHDQQNRILQLINRLIKTLASPEVAVDEKHTPKLYSRFLDGLLLKRNQEMAEADRARIANEIAAVTGHVRQPIPTAAPRPRNPPRINTNPIQEDVKPLPNGGPERLMSPTIQVQAPDEEMGAPATLFDNTHPHAGLLGEPMFRDDTNYAHSTTASSTIDAATRDTATQYSNEDVLMQGDENWIATMGALDDPQFWNHGMLPGFWHGQNVWASPVVPDHIGMGMLPTPTAHMQLPAPHYPQMTTPGQYSMGTVHQHS